VQRFDPPPGLVADVARRWGLAVGAPIPHDGITGWVARARRGDEACVLKLELIHDEALHAHQGLQVWDGDGTVRLLDVLVEGELRALLLEQCTPGVPLSTLAPMQQDEVVAGLLRRLWVDPPAGHPFRPLAQMCGWWADEFWRKPPPALDHGLARAGMELFRTLPCEAPTTSLLVTDLHPGNVLSARREPWLVIDPKPYVGDPTYDPLQHMVNFPDRLAADPLGFADRMAALLDLDAPRLRLWLFARCVEESPEQPEFAEVATTLAP
jgi:streptomycin 6-kinase